MSVRTVMAFVCIILWVSATNAFAQTGSEAPSVTVVSGDLYRVQVDGAATVFLVTGEGIVLVDPLTTPVSHWLIAELETRFPGRPVRHIVHTSHRVGRAGGSWTFRHTARRIAHSSFNRELNRSRSATSTDDIPDVTESYNDRHSISVGGKRVDLLHSPDLALPDLTLVHFPAERVVFMPQLPLAPYPTSFAPSTPKHLLNRIRAIEALPADLLVSDRGHMYRKEDLAPLRRYLEQLLAEAVTARSERRLAALPGSDPARARHVQDAYASLAARSTDIYVLGFFNWLQPADVCSMYLPPCQGAGGGAAGAGGGIRFTVGAVGLAAELLPGRQFHGYVRSQEPTLHDLRRSDLLFEHRETLISLLARYEFRPDRAVTVGIVGGPTVMLQDGRRTGVHLAPPPVRTSYVIESEPSQLGLGVGVEPTFYFNGRAGVTTPIRATFANRTGRLSGVGKWSVHAGVGLVFSVARQVR